MRVGTWFNNFYVEGEGDTQTKAFESLAANSEPFKAASWCPRVDGKNGSDKVILVVREVDGNKFYEARCLEPPFAKLKFGQHKSGGSLFPKREGGVDGWTVYNKETKQEE